MAARPARQFSPIQNTTVQYRRREYDDREADNDNEELFANDNPGPLTDIASGFNQQSYYQNYTKPAETVRRVGNVTQVAGKTAATAGKTAEIGGRALQRGGTAMARAGVALSGTGLGAIVGVPLAIAGGATAAAGTGMSVAGKVSKNAGNASSRSGKMMSRLGNVANDNTIGKRGPSAAQIGKLRNVVGLRKRFKGQVKATRVNMSVLSAATPVWFTVQLPLALAAIVALSLAGVEELLSEGSFLYSIFDGITGGIQYVTGVNLNAVEGLTLVSQALFAALTLLVFLIGMITLFAMATLYTISGVQCFFGEHAGFKMAAFILTMLFYLIPILNIFPWFMLWGIVVWFYPK